MARWYDRRRKAIADAKKGFPLEHKHTPFWCEGHWAPYRHADKDGVYPNGAVGATLITQEFVNSEEYLALEDKSPEALNKHMRAQVRPLCCRLGDEIMNRVLAEAIRCGTKRESHAPVNSAPKKH